MACLLLVSACARLPEAVPDWLVNLTGGEGKIAQPVSSSVIDAPDPSTQALPPAATSLPDIRAVQSDLAELGYQPGAADGKLGPMTRRAIEAYQKDAGLEVNGYITPELVASLAAAPRPRNQAPGEDMAAHEQLAGEAKDSDDGPEPSEQLAGEAKDSEDMPEPPEQLADEAQDSEGIPEPPEQLAEDARESEEKPGTSENPAPPAIVVENANAWPLYGAGDKYIWSTGQSETVARIIGSELIWEISNGVRVKADRNFLVPPSTWTSPKGTGEAMANIDARTSWPLIEGAPLVFEVEENGNTTQWTCESLGGRMVSVPAGRFKAVTLACERTPTQASEWVRRIWMYAPAVRHYVGRTDIMADGRQISKYLVGIQPGAEDWPPAVRAGLERAIQTTLTEVPDGGRKLWSSTVVEEEFEIRPGPIRGQADSDRCRNFTMTARSAKGSRLYPAIACTRGTDNIWQIPSVPGQASDGLSVLTSAG